MGQLLWNGLFVGSFYALVALGYSMVYGIIRLLNFAHGDLYMFGAFVGMWILEGLGGNLASLGLPLLLAVVALAMLATGCLGVVIERVAYRPLRSSPRLSALITAVGASFVLEYGVRLIAGPDPRSYPVTLNGNTSNVLGVHVTLQQIVLVLLAVVLMVGLTSFVSRTRQGRAMRAIAMDQKAAVLMGVDVDKIISRTFFLGSALAGAAGVMAGVFYGQIDFLMGFIIGLKAFTAAVLGGIGNLKGTVLGGLALGTLESFGSAWLGGQWRDVFAFGCLIAVLVVRPSGLLGSTEQVRA